MTRSSDRATLERVAEKLAEVRERWDAGEYAFGGERMVAEALADLRGPLAEPQPDEVIVRDLPYDGRIGALAEPQVNPSEHEDLFLALLDGAVMSETLRARVEAALGREATGP